MNMEIFTVYDSAAMKYLEPFFAETLEVATRMFRTLINRHDHQFGKYPEDYVLFHIGSYCADDAALIPIAPHSLGVGLTFLSHPRLVPDEVVNG